MKLFTIYVFILAQSLSLLADDRFQKYDYDRLKILEEKLCFVIDSLSSISQKLDDLQDDVEYIFNIARYYEVEEWEQW